MEHEKNTPFNVKILKEGEYTRLYVTHKSFKGRIKKRIGNNDSENLNALRYQLMNELNIHFVDRSIQLNEVISYVENFISVKIKGTASIFDYFQEFLEFKQASINSMTERKLTKSTLASYETAKRVFEAYLIKKHISPYMDSINENVLNSFYFNLTGSRWKKRSY